MSKGHDRLWVWFGLGRPSWLTMPRVMMHAMPDDWQERMAALLEEWDAKWDTSDLPGTKVSAVDLVRAGVEALGGKGGGGRPDMAQGGGPDGSKAAEAIAAAKAVLSGA